METSPRPFSGRRLVIAVLVGASLEVVFLAFGLHASLGFARITGNSARTYWALNGAYFVLGFATGLLAVPWHRTGIRIGLFTILLVVFAAWGAARA